MRTLLLCSLFAFFNLTGLSAQDFVVDEKKKIITIFYDLEPGKEYEVSIKAVLNNNFIELEHVTGDVGLVKGGSDKKAYWAFTKQVKSLDGELSFGITAVPIESAKPPVDIPTPTITTTNDCKIPGWQWGAAAGVVVVGGGLVYQGISLESQSQDLYTIYETELDPNSSVYYEKSREDHFNEANTKHQNATYLMVGGGVVLAGGGAYVVSKMIQTKKNCGNQPVGKIRVEPLWKSDEFGNTNVGISIIF